MKRFLSEMSGDVKDFLSNSVNRLTLFIVVFALVVLFMQYKTMSKIDAFQAAISEQVEKSEANLAVKIDKTQDRVNHRYFCLNNTLKSIFNVDIDTKTGEIK